MAVPSAGCHADADAFACGAGAAAVEGEVMSAPRGYAVRWVMDVARSRVAVVRIPEKMAESRGVRVRPLQYGGWEFLVSGVVRGGAASMHEAQRTAVARAYEELRGA